MDASVSAWREEASPFTQTVTHNCRSASASATLRDVAAAAGITCSKRLIVVSGAPGTGKSTVARLISRRLDRPLLSVDIVKECLADVLGLGDEAWSNSLGDAAAATVFRLARDCPGAVVEGWWRRERRDRAIVEFAGAVEVFCHCEPSLAEQRLAERLADDRHPIHRDVINPSIVAGVSDAARTTRPLGLGGLLVQVDTAGPVDPTELVRAIAAPR